MGKTWIITGASAGGIGEGIARAVLAKGDNAVITARSLSKLEGIAQDYPDTCLPFALDICSQEAIKACVKAAVDKFGTVDVLINNAGHGYRSSVEEGEEAAIRELYETRDKYIQAMTEIKQRDAIAAIMELITSLVKD